MQPLSAKAMLAAWEHGRDRHPVDRALILRALSAPDADQVTLADEPLGRCNAALLELRAETFGATLRAQVNCVGCEEELELELDTAVLLREPRTQADSVVVGDHRFRPPCNRDLARIAVVIDPDTATAQLLALCSLDEVETDRLAVMLSDVESALERADPWSDLSLEVRCDACGRTWSETLDVPALLWGEVAFRARRLLDEVHMLAVAYGWSENDILALSDQRRAGYLQRITA